MQNISQNSATPPLGVVAQIALLSAFAAWAIADIALEAAWAIGIPGMLGLSALVVTGAIYVPLCTVCGRTGSIIAIALGFVAPNVALLDKKLATASKFAGHAEGPVSALLAVLMVAFVIHMTAYLGKEDQPP